MPEAVIVATARSPIGRAFKGSLKDIRPDDLTVQMIQAALAKVPQLDPTTIDDLMLGCGLPGGEQGFNMARVVAVLLGLDTVPGTTVTRYCSSSLQTTRMAFHAIKAGEGDVFVSAGRGDACPGFAKGSSDSLARHPEPGLRRRHGRDQGAPAQGGTIWHDPREDGDAARRLHRDGPDRREPRPAQGRQPRRSRTSSASARRTWPRRRIANGFWEKDITPVTLPDGTVVSKDDGPRAGTTYEKVSALKPVFRPDGTVTAGNCCPLNDGAAAVVVMSDVKAAELGHHPARPDRLHRRHRPVARDHGPRPGRGLPAGAGPGRAWRSTTSTSSRSTRRSPPRSSRPTRTSASTSTGSTSTAAPSRSATRSA